MNTISKRFRYNKMWEIVMVDGQVYFLAKDVLTYFGFSASSQQTIRNTVDADQITILTGEPVRNLKHVSNRAMVITYLGLEQFINKKLSGMELQKGLDFVSYVRVTVLPEMKALWKKLPTETVGLDLIEMAEKIEVVEFIEKVKDLELRVKELEKEIEMMKGTTIPVTSEMRFFNETEFQRYMYIESKKRAWKEWE